MARSALNLQGSEPSLKASQMWLPWIASDALGRRVPLLLATSERDSMSGCSNRDPTRKAVVHRGAVPVERHPACRMKTIPVLVVLRAVRVEDYGPRHSRKCSETAPSSTSPGRILWFRQYVRKLSSGPQKPHVPKYNVLWPRRTFCMGALQAICMILGYLDPLMSC